MVSLPGSGSTSGSCAQRCGLAAADAEVAASPESAGLCGAAAGSAFAAVDINASLNKKNGFLLLSHGVSIIQKYHFGKQSSGEPR